MLSRQGKGMLAYLACSYHKVDETLCLDTLAVGSQNPSGVAASEPGARKTRVAAFVRKSAAMRNLVATIGLTISLLGAASALQLTANGLHRDLPALPLGLWRNLRHHEDVIAQSDDVKLLRSKYQPQYLQVPVDHFDDTNNATFALRFWADDTYYKPGGPVFCLDGGETSGEDRSPFLDHGILKLLSQATNGLSIVLEHRYYGTSMPVEDLSTDNMRFLTTQQALADNAYFTKHAKVKGLSAEQAKAFKDSKWIHYGGSYAGAKVALLRKRYPDVVFGAIASSAVTAAVEDYWKYFEAIRLHGNQDCVHAIVETVSLVDTILQLNSPESTRQLKDRFGLANLTHVQDFVALLTFPLGAWQAQNWDSKVSSTGFQDFCSDLLGQGQKTQLVDQSGSRRISLLQTRENYLDNYAQYIRNHVLPYCRIEQGQTYDECFGTFNDTDYQQTGLEQTWRSWTWQYCTEWGYLQNAAPPGVPSLLSRFIDLNYTSQICRQAFPDGKHASMPHRPNVTEINQYGGYILAYDRIAFIDGSFDPWIYATPHSPDVKQRKSTTTRPFELIKGGVHHWDGNSLPSCNATDLSDEPQEIRRVHQRELDFVKSWLKDAA